MNLYRKVVLSLVIALPLSSLVSAQDAVKQLADKLQVMDTLLANFQQTIKDSQGAVLQQASGVLKVKRPRRFYWRTETPYEHLVVTDGKILWLHDLDLEQVSKQPFSADMDKAPALLLSGEIAEISKQYQVQALTSQQFVLSPRTDDGVFKQLTLEFRGASISGMILRDSLDQTTIIEFSSVRMNQPLADEIFQFTPPKGVDVINNEP
ncbi:outer membrane lipoprotein chaperone LolA [Oceanicoccus sp. KOV_DT_Chl]|uniref:outer membrane lipoprotein chaperone LolA n=1 Tax=Oceanicoccus sp. KOV_DT_Chl TaxID=1904639 RepID=UPI001F3B8828|nr:outer membrane lipoprotein chaperone LolA [Oceanicoccus sp. KOV_DT_Chl]